MQAYEAFVQVLEIELDLVNQLAALGEKKQGLINRADQVQQIAREEQALLEQLDMQEQERMNLLDVIAPGKSLDEWANGVDDARVQELAEQLKERFARLRALNDINRQLINESLAYVRFSLDLLVDETPTTYAKKGKSSASKSFFDRKV